VKSLELERGTDEELVARFAERDMAAFRAVYHRHAGAAYSLAFAIVGDRNRAEDVTQEALVSVWRAGTRYDPGRGSVRAWLLAIVRNRSIDMLRREAVQRVDARRDPTDVLAEMPSAERTDVEVARRDTARGVIGALDALSADQASVVKLAYYGGFSHSEIADMLDTPVGTVKSRMRLALEKMRVHLSEGYS
jgi:RNA polymerase sigma-70 factor (ECF subfamily)